MGGVSLIILVLGITYAWFEWQSNTNTNVTFEVGDLGITYIGEENVLSKVLYPTASMTNPDNVIHTFSLTTSSNIDIYSKISLDIINIDEELKDESFVWKLYRNDTYIAGGNFLNAIQGSDVLLIQNEKITNELTNYTLYIWIDGVNYNNPLDMGGKSFNFKLKFEAGQVDYVTDKECFAFDESTGSITDYLCYSGNTNDLPVITDVVIPSEIDGIKVTTIGRYAFSNNNLTSVVIPNSVTSIGYSAFKSNNLTSVVIPDSVTSIEIHAFSYNNLTSVVIPDSVTTIKSSAFEYNDLTSVVIPSSVKKLSGFDNNNLTSVVIPDSVTEISDWAFSNNNLTSVVIPDSVTYIDDWVFSDNNLTSVTIGNGVTTIGGSAFSYNDLTEIVIPSSVKKLSGFDNNNLTSVTIGNGVTTIGGSAFSSNNLTEIVIPDSVIEISNQAFENNNLTSIVIPNSVESIGNFAFQENNLTSVVIPDSVTSINNSAFYKNPTLTSIEVSSDNKVFDSRDNSNAIIETSTNTLVVGCKNTIIPNTVTSIGQQAFSSMGLTEIVIPDSVETIGKYAFSYNNLTSVTIGNSVTSIGNYAFSYNNLTSVLIPNSVESIDYRAFYSNSSSNPNLTTIYNTTGRSFYWNNIIRDSSSTSFITGTVTTSDNRVVTITALE